MPKAQDNVLIINFRLNIDNPQHMKIAKVINNLNPDIYKSKNKYIADALEFFIDNYGSDAFTLNKAVEDNSFIKKKDFNEMRTKIEEEAVTAARNEVIRLLGGIVMNSGNMTRITAQKDETEHQPDDTLRDLVSDWDDM